MNKTIQSLSRVMKKSVSSGKQTQRKWQNEFCRAIEKNFKVKLDKLSIVALTEKLPIKETTIEAEVDTNKENFAKGDCVVLHNLLNSLYNDSLQKIKEFEPQYLGPPKCICNVTNNSVNFRLETACYKDN